MTESLQNKKKIGKSSKKEEGGDEKHVFSFTRPKIACIYALAQSLYTLQASLYTITRKNDLVCMHWKTP